MHREDEGACMIDVRAGLLLLAALSLGACSSEALTPAQVTYALNANSTFSEPLTQRLQLRHQGTCSDAAVADRDWFLLSKYSLISLTETRTGNLAVCEAALGEALKRELYSQSDVSGAGKEHENAVVIPVARRAMLQVLSIECSREGECLAQWRWKWNVTRAGEALQQYDEVHQGSAVLLKEPAGWRAVRVNVD